MDAAAPLEPFTLLIDDDRSELAPGDRLGNWTLRQELGSGGMGRVFLAERSDGHYQQRAAIKLLLGWNNDDGLEQLARERQILANLAHPNIARLIDGGTTPMGRPYLVMDYVEGVPLHEHCRRHGLGLAAVLALFEQVLQAVAAAHRQLVVHCDLKPGNVLVTAEGRAMLLDFGIARLQGPHGEQTLHDVATWTPRYASPEQKRGAKPGVASDIYSLGRMLQDLLEPLALPHRRVREWQAIVARASADDPEQRYASVGALQDDLARLLAHRPVRALPRSPGYRAAKLLRRRWPWALAALGVLVLTVGFTLRLMHERDRAWAAEQRAVAQAEATQAVSDFVVALFQGADPAVTGRRDMPASELVARGRDRADRDMARQPGLLAGLKNVLGKVFDNMGRPADAVAQYRQAAELAARRDVAQPLLQAQALSRLAVALANQAHGTEALPPARQALALVRAQAQPDAAALADALNTLGVVLQQQQAWDEAQTHLREALALRESLHGTQSHDAAIVRHNLALVLRGQRRLPEAEAEIRRAIGIKQAVLSGDHPSTLASQEELGRILNLQRRFAEAEAIFVEALAHRQRLYGELNEKTAHTINELANVLQDVGRVDEAVQRYRDAVRIQASVQGTRSMGYAVALNNLATALEEQGHVTEAGSAFRESLAMRQAVLPEGDLAVARAQHNLARFLVRTGQAAAARPLLEAAAAVRDSRLPAGHRERLDVLLLRAELAAAEARAQPLAEALAALEPQAKALNEQRQVPWLLLQGRLAELQGRPEQALQKLQQAFDQGQRALPPRHPDLQRAGLALARARLAAGDREAAQAALQQLAPALASHDTASPLAQQAQALGRVLQAKAR